MSDSVLAARARPSELTRQVQLLSAELGAIRTKLKPEQHATFDSLAYVWLREQARRGYQVAIPGVPPAP